jgi:hypothetical protein
MKSTVIKVWNKRTDVSNPIHSPMSKADAVVLDSVHVDGKISLYCIEYKFDRSIDRIVWCTEYNPVACGQNHCSYLSVAMGTSSVMLVPYE